MRRNVVIQRPAIAAEPRSARDRIPMADLVIEREVLIEAPVEVVWRTITEPDQMSQWFADRVELVVEPGAHGFMQFGDQGGPVVIPLEPSRRGGTSDGQLDARRVHADTGGR